MTAARFALIFGIIYTLVGIAGFFPSLVSPPTGNRHLALGALHGNLLGLFPVNFLHSLFHLAIGAWGLLAAMSYGAPVVYARTVAIIYGVLAAMGLIPGLNTLFGLIPLHGHDVWLHAGSALIAAYFGFVIKHEAERA